MSSWCIHLLLLVMLSILISSKKPVPFDEDRCVEEIDKHNSKSVNNPKHLPITEEFPEIVVHGVHSMTLANLRYYFGKKAPADNGIPVINFNLSTSEPPVLDSTPDIPLHNNFQHPAMDALDQTLSHMTDNDWGIRNAPILERVTHAIHMLEVWEMAKPFYKQIKRNKYKGMKKKLCPCLTAVGENGILDMMKDLAKKMRDTRAVWRYGSCTCCYGGGIRPRPIFSRPGKFPGPDYSRPGIFSRPDYGCDGPIPSQVVQPLGVPNRPGGGIRSLGQVEPHTNQPTTNLTNEAEWEIWKVNMDMSKAPESHGYQLALYLFCALN